MEGSKSPLQLTLSIKQTDQNFKIAILLKIVQRKNNNASRVDITPSAWG